MVKRVLLGKLPDGHYGLRISDPGYDVTSDPVDNEKLIFNSDWPAVLPIYQTGLLMPNGSTVSASYPDLGYAPFCAALVNVGGRGWEQYATTNVLFRAQSAIGYRDVQNVFTTYSNSYMILDINATNTGISVYCSGSASVIYYVYRMRAF